MNVTIESSGDLMIAYLIGELDHHSAAEIRLKIDSAISYKKPKYLILDFKNISFMDSSGIGLVMGRYRLIQNYKGQLEIRNVTPQTKKIMELAGLSRIAAINERKEKNYEE
ncbi:MAG: anti-sigma factor antagonist [Clostridiales bacterium]|nr:anti-sigma factor antagonist [Clostridiales bacterium]